jgi:protein TonB
MTPGARTTRRGTGLVTLGASIALHAGLLLAVLLAVSGETELGALFIDLTESGQSEITRGGAPRPAAVRGGRTGSRALRPIVAAHAAPAPSTSPGSGEPSSPTERASFRDSARESHAPEPPALPPATAAPGQAPEPMETPRAADASTASAPGAPGAAEASSSASAPGGSATESEVFRGHGVRGGGPGVAPDVSHGFTLAVGGGGAVGPTGPGAEYGAYLARLRARVQQALRYPLAARRRGLSGTVHVDIVIRPDGAIGAVAVADSSSHAVLDEAAMEAIKRLAAEPLPRDVAPRTLRVRLPVVFALE